MIDKAWTIISVICIILIFITIGGALERCGTPECPPRLSDLEVEKRINTALVGRLRAMDRLERTYGVELPSYPFNDDQVCMAGDVEIKRVDIEAIRKGMESSGVGTVLAQWQFNDDYTYGQYRVAVKISERIVLLLSSNYASTSEELARHPHADVCEISDRKCMNRIANNFVE